MSSPAVSCSRRYTDNASTYCSRNRLITIASRNDLSPRFSVYQLGRGSDPVIVVGNTVPAVAFNIGRVSSGSAPRAGATLDPIIGTAGYHVRAAEAQRQRQSRDTQSN